MDAYFDKYKNQHYSWTHCDHYVYHYTGDTCCTADGTGGCGRKEGVFGRDGPLGVTPTEATPDDRTNYLDWFDNQYYRQAVWEGYVDNGVTKSIEYPWEEFAFCIATTCMYDMRFCVERPCKYRGEATSPGCLNWRGKCGRNSKDPDMEDTADPTFCPNKPSSCVDRCKGFREDRCG